MEGVIAADFSVLSPSSPRLFKAKDTRGNMGFLPKIPSFSNVDLAVGVDQTALNGNDVLSCDYGVPRWDNFKDLIKHKGTMGNSVTNPKPTEAYRNDGADAVPPVTLTPPKQSVGVVRISSQGWKKRARTTHQEIGEENVGGAQQLRAENLIMGAQKRKADTLLPGCQGGNPVAVDLETSGKKKARSQAKGDAVQEHVVGVAVADV